jgi:hypothetical protein
MGGTDAHIISRRENSLGTRGVPVVVRARIDGQDADCGPASQFLTMGAAEECPGYGCGPYGGSNGFWYTIDRSVRNKERATEALGNLPEGLVLRSLRIGTLFGILVLCVHASRGVAVTHFPSALISISGGELGGGAGGEVLDLAISPDNSRIAVTSVTSAGKDRLSVWLSEWAIGNKKLISESHLKNSVSPATAFIGLEVETMQYTPDGSKIVALTENGVCAYESDTLHLRYCVVLPEFSQSSPIKVYQDRFAISADGKSLAVLSGQSELPSRIGSVGLYETNDGKEIASWPAPAHLASLALSPEGTGVLVVVDQPNEAADILLINSASGNLTAKFASRFERESGKCAGKALFLDQSHFVVTPGGCTDARGHYSGNTLEVFDSRTGEITTELTADKFGPSGSLWVSSREPIVVALSMWASSLKRHIKVTEGSPKSGELFFFQTTRKSGPCIVGPLPKYAGQLHNRSGFIRFSADLGIIGLCVSNRIEVYSVPECEGAGD